MIKSTDDELNFEIASKEEALWLKVKTTTETRIQELKDDLTINQEVLKVAEAKLQKIDDQLLA